MRHFHITIIVLQVVSSPQLFQHNGELHAPLVPCFLTQPPCCIASQSPLCPDRLWAQPASPGVKRQEREAHLQLVSRLRIRGTSPPRLVCTYMGRCYLFRYLRLPQRSRFEIFWAVTSRSEVFTLKTETAKSPETLVSYLNTTRHQSPEDRGWSYTFQLKEP
jgi:hypothetical protein